MKAVKERTPFGSLLDSFHSLLPRDETSVRLLKFFLCGTRSAVLVFHVFLQWVEKSFELDHLDLIANHGPSYLANVR